MNLYLTTDADHVALLMDTVNAVAAREQCGHRLQRCGSLTAVLYVVDIEVDTAAVRSTFTTDQPTTVAAARTWSTTAVTNRCIGLSDSSADSGADRPTAAALHSARVAGLDRATPHASPR